MANQDDVLEIEILNNIDHVLRVSVETPVLAGYLGCAVPSEIYGNDPISILECGNLRVPIRSINTPSMYEKEGLFPVASNCVFDFGRFGRLAGTEQYDEGKERQ